MSAKEVNLVHSKASPEELAEEVSNLEATGISSSSAAVDVP